MTKTQEEITRNMRSNKSKDTKPELLLRSELWKRGLRYRKNYKKISRKTRHRICRKENRDFRRRKNVARIRLGKSKKRFQIASRFLDSENRTEYRER